jgi:alanyl-tRNA synthetase
MNSSAIREQFLAFFQEKLHQKYASAPIVVKNDPTLMFTNAGMNQFKDWFLGNEKPAYNRVVNSQKCLRVSGKHNDLEEVGVDHYHHTMFEMLGNWSFGDYFKKEAIDWAWELLTKRYQLDTSRMYVTVFEGDASENLAFDSESHQIWTQHVSADRILNGNKKDNFWEMGETGPCGPCTEIHYDMRSDAARQQVSGATLVNKDHPEVIEIWNLVFMEFNRKADGSLVSLPAKHVDTGMGFERLVRVIQEKKSNYDTDVFTPLLEEISRLTGIAYEGTQSRKDIAFRVIADHIRAISFTIADGQLPASNGAGYVVRRILRRAVRYYYSFLDKQSPLLHQLVPVLTNQLGSYFPELKAQQSFIEKVILEEENAFLRTLAKGLELLKTNIEQNNSSVIEGKLAFELYDTFGFPIDLTHLIAQENSKTIDNKGFEEALAIQKERSRSDAQKATGDWIELKESYQTNFVGYDTLRAETTLCKYRTQEAKGKLSYQVVLETTPFYPEGGGQVGDTGYLIGTADGEKIEIIDTKKENNLLLHLLETLPQNPSQTFVAEVDSQKRKNAEANHSATHLLHAALRQVLGTHVQQKGSLVTPKSLRFDFSHFAKLNPEEIKEIEAIVNRQIKRNIALREDRAVPMQEAIAKGAMALFGEKYGEAVRVITFDPEFSVELCGGTHVAQTSQIGYFKILNESAVAAGVRRIEAITAEEAIQYLENNTNALHAIQDLLQNPKDTLQSIRKLQIELQEQRSVIEKLQAVEVRAIKQSLLPKVQTKENYALLIQKVELSSAETLKDLCFQLKNENPSLVGVMGCIVNGKPTLAVFAGENIAGKEIKAGSLIKQLASHIQGGGGGQDFYASAGGSFPEGLDTALAAANALL